MKAHDKIKKKLDKDMTAEATISIVYYYGKDEMSREVKRTVVLLKGDTLTLTFDGLIIT